MGTAHSHALHHHGHSPLHRTAPHVKVVAAVLFATAVAVTPQRRPEVFVLHAAVLASAALVAGLPPRFVLRRLWAAAPFLVLAATVPFVSGGERIEVAGVTMSEPGLWAGGSMAAKALLGLGGAIVLVGSTEAHAVISGLRRLRVPATVVAIAQVMLRYLVLLTDELGRARTAVAARGHEPRWLGHAPPVAAAAGSVFVRAYERGERVHGAMVSRGFTGDLPVGDAPALGPGRWTAVLAAPLMCLAVAVGAGVAT